MLELGYFVGTLIWNFSADKHVGKKFCLCTSSQRLCLLFEYCHRLNIKCPLQALVCTLEPQLNCYCERFRTYEEMRCSRSRLVTRSKTLRVYYPWLVHVSFSLFPDSHKVNSSASHVIFFHCSNALLHYWPTASSTKCSLWGPLKLWATNHPSLPLFVPALLWYQWRSNSYGHKWPKN